MEATVIEHRRGHYEVLEVHHGRDYVWCPECVVVECECGERLYFTGPEEALCRCGRSHAEMVREELEVRRMREEGEVPWREEAKSGPDRSEYRDWMELNELD